LFHQSEYTLVVDLTKEVRDVGLKDKLLALGEGDTNGFHGVGGRTLGSKPKRTGQKVRLEQRFEHQLRRLLGHAITDSRNA
jgi:hypothetical protein